VLFIRLKRSLIKFMFAGLRVRRWYSLHRRPGAN
jgi:hypothetical protein